MAEEPELNVEEGEEEEEEEIPEVEEELEEEPLHRGTSLLKRGLIAEPEVEIEIEPGAKQSMSH